MIKAVVFDCFGVLVGSGFDDTYIALGGDPKKDAGFINDILRRANTGLVTNEDFEQEIISRLGISEDRYREAVNKTERLNEELCEYIKNTLKPHFKIALLSNANAGTIERTIPEDWRGLFDEIIVSAEVGMVKPNPAIYELVANKLGIEPREAVFIDDLPQHTAGAELAGMKTVLYENFIDLKEKLATILDEQNEPVSYEDAIRKLAGEEAEVIPAPASHINEVFLVNEREVYRFPKTREALEHQIFEWDILEHLNRHNRPPIAMPKPLRMVKRPKGFVYQYIAGHTISEQELLACDKDSRREFIENLLGLIHWLGKAIQPDTFEEILSRSSGKKIESWNDYISRTVGKYESIEHEALREVSAGLFHEITQHYPGGLGLENRVIHDDLHTGNLLFDEANNLVGVIDFGDITLADLACEFRHFYRLEPDIAKVACEIWNQKYDEKIEYEKVEFWAKISEATVLTAKVQKGDLSAPAVKRTLANLSKWYPDKVWSF